MKYKIGDTVAFLRNDAVISDHACLAWGIDYFNIIEFKNCKFFKGKITKIKTHSWFVKLEEPLYIIDDYYIVKKIKPLITLPATI
jgi:hypothetical protein